MDGDQDDSNDCNPDEVTTRDITGVVFTSCRSDAPLLGWIIKKSRVADQRAADAVWVPTVTTADTAPKDQKFHQDGGSLVWQVTAPADLKEWPGTAFTPSGIAIDYPGWRPIEASDIAPDGGYYNPANGEVMTPDEQALLVYNGLIVDPSEIDFAWRLKTTDHVQREPDPGVRSGLPAGDSGVQAGT